MKSCRTSPRSLNGSLRLLVLPLTLLLCLGVHAQRDSASIVRLTNQFEMRKGSLGCPMESGRFDRETLYVNTENKPTAGFDIHSKSAQVNAIARGVVVYSLPDENGRPSLLLSHGDYFCSYKHLSEVSVKAGQQIREGDALGTAAPYEQHFKLHFELWKFEERLWPPDWLDCR